MFGLGQRLLLFLLFAVAMVPDAALQAGREPDGPSQDRLTGKLLVATPSLSDPNFAHTVVYLVHHNAAGAMGLVVNRVLATGPLSSLLEGLGIDTNGTAGQIRVYAGGPVARSKAFVLHSADYRSGQTIAVDDRVALTPSLDVLRAMAKGNGPRHAILALGYAGWGPNQLENEIAQGAWYVVPADEALLFDEQVETKWQRAQGRRGIDL